jgi:hypothetical protein
MSAGLQCCAVPTSIHCDHLIQASEGAEKDLPVMLFACLFSGHLIPLSGQSLQIKRSLTFFKVLPVNTASSSGHLAQV